MKEEVETAEEMQEREKHWKEFLIELNNFCFGLLVLGLFMALIFCIVMMSLGLDLNGNQR